MQNKERKHYIKVNIPEDETGYREGYGEGVWVLVDDDVKADYDNDAEGKTCVGTLDNDSIYHRWLVHGIEIPFEMRGYHRPVVSYQWIAAQQKLHLSSLIRQIGAWCNG